ncbi:MAG: VOC family protein [Planctomycetota bacterium]|nr:VOC family protein [Planctomycetota bacterium]
MRVASLICVLLLTGVASSEEPKPPLLSGKLVCVLPVRDVKAAARWYKTALGLEARVERIRFLQDIDEVAEEPEYRAIVPTPLPDVIVNLYPKKQAKSVGGPWLTFGVVDLDAARKKLEEKKVVFVGETFTVPGLVKLATFHDPDGNKFKLFQLLQPHAPKTGTGALGYTKTVIAAHATTDMKASQKWYRDVMGFKLFFYVKQMGWSEMGTPVRGLVFGLQLVEKKPNILSGGFLRWSVRSLDAARKHLKDNKALLDRPESDAHKRKIETFRDPTGNKVQFYEK